MVTFKGSSFIIEIIIILFGGMVFKGSFIVCQLDNNECNPKGCRTSIIINHQKVVCGSDGLTYPNRCELEIVRCKNKNVTFIKRGPCKKQRRCSEWKDFVLDFPQYKFIGKCKRNGAYEAGQCHPESDHCWCVTPEGIPIPDTVRVRNKRVGKKAIRCGKKLFTRSSPSGGNSAIRSCRSEDQKIFNINLLNSFHSEYNREYQRNATDMIIMLWKFTNLDSNNDNELDRREFKDIKRLVAKAMKPKKCAKLFPRSCDLDKNMKISRHEWQDCLPRDGLSDGSSSSASASASSGELPILESSDNTGDNNDNENADYDTSSSSSDTGGSSSPDGLLKPNIPYIMPDGEESIINSRDEEPSGCLSDRKLALEEGNVVGTTTYIPDCTADGHYKKIQCYNSVGYCWCVNEDTGQTITGTSTKGGLPNCDIYKPPLKPMKGCPEEKKVIFVQELIKYFRSKISSGDVSPPDTMMSFIFIDSTQDQALKSFNYLDKNNNKILEKSEWKALKDMVLQVKSLKKCGKKLPKYCDSNKDKAISTTEWLDCLTVQKSNTGSIPSTSQSNLDRINSRMGKPNPLSVLKDD